MITERYNINEIKREIINDMEFITKANDRLRDSFGRIVMKRTNFKKPLIIWKEVTSPSKNKYLMMFKAEKRSDWKNPIIEKIAMWNTSKGVKATSLRVNNFHVLELNICTAHFLKRYRERMRFNNLSDVELIETYFSRNDQFRRYPLDNEILKYSDELKDSDSKMFYVFADGLGFGNYLGDFDFQFNTFVSDDMMFTNQEEIVLPIRDKYITDMTYDKWGNPIKIAA